MVKCKNLNINPWLGMWLCPKLTIRACEKHMGLHFVHLLMVSGVLIQLVRVPVNFYNSIIANVILYLLLSVIGGLSLLYVLGPIIKWSGTWIGGRASLKSIMIAMSWAQVPVITFFIIQLIVLAIVRFNTANLFYTVLRFVIAFWSLIVFLVVLSEVQKFSFIKAFFNYFASLTIFMFLLVVVAIVVKAL